MRRLSVQREAAVAANEVTVRRTSGDLKGIGAVWAAVAANEVTVRRLHEARERKDVFPPQSPRTK